MSCTNGVDSSNDSLLDILSCVKRQLRVGINTWPAETAVLHWWFRGAAAGPAGGREMGTAATAVSLLPSFLNQLSISPQHDSTRTHVFYKDFT